MWIFAGIAIITLISWSAWQDAKAAATAAAAAGVSPLEAEWMAFLKELGL